MKKEKLPLWTVGVLALSVTYGATLPLLSLRDIFPRSGGSLSSKGEALAKRETLRGLPRAPTLGELANECEPERAS